MSSALTIIATHCARTLPDSIMARTELLQALEKILTAEHPALPSVRAQLAALGSIEHLQRELPLCFDTGKTPKRTNR